MLTIKLYYFKLEENCTLDKKKKKKKTLRLTLPELSNFLSAPLGF